MNVGTICYDCRSGLGYLAKSFFDAGVVRRIMVVPHPHYPKAHWYPREATYRRADVDHFLDGLDVLLGFENFFQWNVAKQAKQRGIALCLMCNYEYTPANPRVKPDLLWCPSLLDYDYYRNVYPCHILKAPVQVEWRLREKALTFVHNAGHGQRGWAKGTPQILEAMRYVKSPIRLIVRGQPEERRVRELLSQHQDDPRIEIVMREIPDQADLWKEGDVFLNSESYNGMSLMLQEAFAAGMLVMTTDRYPSNTYLPQDPLIPVDHYEDDAIEVRFKRAVVTPQAIAQKIDEWYGRGIAAYSLEGQQWAAEHSWEALRPRFVNMLGQAIDIARRSRR